MGRVRSWWVREVDGRLQRWPEPRHRLTRTQAVLIVAAGYLTIHGWSTVRAFRTLLAPEMGDTSPWGAWTRMGQISTEVGMVLLLAVAVWALSRWLWDTSPFTRPPGDWIRSVAVAAAYFLLTFGSFGLMELIRSATGRAQGQAFPDSADPVVQLHSYTSSAIAGPEEELLYVGLIPCVMRSARFGWPTIVATSAILRLSFHAYYGLPAFGLLPWAVLSVVLYLLTRRLWPMVVMHSSIDLVATANLHEHGDAAAAVPLALMVVAGWLAFRHQTPTKKTTNDHKPARWRRGRSTDDRQD